MSTYNGWSNYATWRVNLELFDDYNVWDKHLMSDAYELSHHLRDTAEVYIEDTSTEGLARDYAMAFLSDVNWYEIAQHLIAEYTEEVESHV
jgi:hypothetical protein